MSKTTPDQQRENLQAYMAAKPKQFGNLHERMKYLKEVATVANDASGYKFDNDTWQAIWDLETEVKYYKAENPPFGRRPRLGG